MSCGVHVSPLHHTTTSSLSSMRPLPVAPAGQQQQQHAAKYKIADPYLPRCSSGHICDVLLLFQPQVKASSLVHRILLFPLSLWEGIIHSHPRLDHSTFRILSSSGDGWSLLLPWRLRCSCMPTHMLISITLCDNARSAILSKHPSDSLTL